MVESALILLENLIASYVETEKGVKNTRPTILIQRIDHCGKNWSCVVKAGPFFEMTEVGTSPDEAIQKVSSLITGKILSRYMAFKEVVTKLGLPVPY